VRNEKSLKKLLKYMKSNRSKVQNKFQNRSIN